MTEETSGSPVPVDRSTSAYTHVALAAQRPRSVQSEAFRQVLRALEADLKRANTDEARLRHSLDRARELSGAERGFVLMQSPASMDMVVVAAHGLDPSTLWTTAEVSLTLIRRALLEGRAILTDNATADPRFSEINSVVLSGLRSVLCVPFRSGKRTTALLYLDNRLQIGAFTAVHLDALELLARKVSSRLSLPRPRRGRGSRSAARRRITWH